MHKVTLCCGRVLYRSMEHPPLGWDRQLSSRAIQYSASCLLLLARARNLAAYVPPNSNELKGCDEKQCSAPCDSCRTLAHGVLSGTCCRAAEGGARAGAQGELCSVAAA